MIERFFKYDIDDADEFALRRDTNDFSNLARNFFYDGDTKDDNEFRIIRTFQETGPFSKNHVENLIAMLQIVRGRIADREAHEHFPQNLKDQYLENFDNLIPRWLDILEQL